MNKNITTIIVEDEPHMRDLIIKKLSDFSSFIEVVDTANNVDEAIKKITTQQPDLIFLDIQLKNRNSFEILEQLPYLKSEIIFLTAYNDYVLKAIKFSAIDYILKPINNDDFFTAINKAKKRIEEKKENERLKYLIQTINNPLDKENKIGIPTIDGYEFVKIKDIIRCEADRNYTLIILDDDEKTKVLSSYNLKEFEILLNEMDFCRVHKSHLVNISHIKRYSKSDGAIIIMSDGSNIPISRTKKEDFLQRIRTI